MARRGRGRLSTIDLLPEEAEPVVVTAMQALRERNKPQAQILAEMNASLADLGVKSISRSAFNRKALWLAAYGTQIERTREIAAIVGEKLEAAPDGDVGLLLGETLKTLIFDVLTDMSLSGKSPSMSMLNEAAESLRFLEAARKMSVETRVRIGKEFGQKAAEAVDQAAAEKGLSADTVTAIKARILGVMAPAKEGAAAAA